MGTNKLVIVSAGSGKTTYLVRQALAIERERVLITTYTESNEEEIRRKFFEINGSVPGNVHIQTWFSLLIEHGIKPFQGKLFNWDVAGMLLVSQKSGFRGRNRAGHPIYWAEKDFRHYYFDHRNRVYSDKLSRLMIRCNEASNGNVIERLSRIYPFIFVDEVQDLAGSDLDILVAFFRSPANVVMVGDPRQVTYVTHLEARLKKYRDGGIADFIRAELPRGVTCDIDENSLMTSHRNSPAICELSSKLYPKLTAATACQCPDCRRPAPDDAGLFIVRRKDLPRYLEVRRPVQLRWSSAEKMASPDLPTLTFGRSKGLGFDSVIIYPTTEMKGWLKNTNSDLKAETRAKLYVGITRARYSVAVVYDPADGEVVAGFNIFE